MDNDEYKLVAPLVPLSASKRPSSTSSCYSIPHLPTDSSLPQLCHFILWKGDSLQTSSGTLCVHGVCGCPGDDFKWVYPLGSQFVPSAKSMCVMEEHSVAYLKLLKRGPLDVIFFLAPYLLGQCIRIGFWL
ncbi:hypothetical protein DSO57_1005814 [Entomophthora muscae]|uniref:Uncharacterized protein n=1 Tax=Entomophthora muscae TaxID=34485 RepID=A0ACC2TJ38_9FUNG|nr:hypothetical protein DSO57_1005814 [Entomophthora muscae]